MDHLFVNFKLGGEANATVLENPGVQSTKGLASLLDSFGIELLIQRSITGDCATKIFEGGVHVHEGTCSICS